jgi:hypothetical protein
MTPTFREGKLNSSNFKSNIRFSKIREKISGRWEDFSSQEDDRCHLSICQKDGKMNLSIFQKERFLERWVESFICHLSFATLVANLKPF